MRMRWAIAVVGVVALAAVAVNFYMPWRTTEHAVDAPEAHDASAATASCPADAKPANLDFTMKDVNGKDVTLADYKGKVSLLDFWATWCPPCEVEIPWFADFQKRFGKDGLQVIGISIDDPLDKLVPYIKEKKMNYIVLQGLGHEEVQEAFGPIVALPYTVLIGRDGRVCAQHTGLTGNDVFEREIKALL